MNAFTHQVMPGMPPNQASNKTRVVSILWALQQVYGVSNVVCEACDHMNAGRTDMSAVMTKRDYLEIVAMDAVLSRTLSAPRRVTGEEEMDTPVMYRVTDKKSLGPAFDAFYRAFVVVVPDGATFYCHRERRRETIGVRNALIPMDTSWLRLIKNGDRERRFAGGGYVERLWDDQPFWRFKISRGDSNFQLETPKERPIDSLSWSASSAVPPLKVFSAWQCPDEDGPCLPPDFIGGKQYDAVTHKQHLKNVYKKALREAKSSRVGCRHYVPGFLHRVIDPDETLVIDPKEGDVDIRVAVQVLSPSGKRKSRAVAEDSGRTRWRKRLPVSLSRESVVHVRYLPKLGVGAEKLLNDIRDHSRDVTADRKDVGVRVGLGDQGNMHPVGTRIMLDKVKRQRYAASSKKCWQGPLRRSIVAAAKLASAVVPGILRIIQDAERDGGISPPAGGMSGDEAAFCYVCHSLDISVDLANSSHYDSNDASVGFTIWTEDVPGGTKNWYFVLPNVYGKWPLGMRAGKKSLTYQGVAIKLTHGTMISWDGRVIRHATSVVDEARVDNGDKPNHRYGNFFAAKSSVVAFGARMALMKKLEEAIRRRCRVKVDREGEAADEVGPLDAPIPRKGKEIVEGDVAHCEDDEGDYDADADDGGRSWCGHSYASGSGGDDDDHMSISDDGGELLEGVCCDVDDDDDNLGSVPVEVGVLDVSVGLDRTLAGHHNNVSIPDVTIPVEVRVSLPVEVGVSLPVRVDMRDGDRDARDGGVGMRCEDRRGCPDYWLNGGDLHQRDDGQSSGSGGFAWRGGGCRPDRCAHDWSRHSGGDDWGGRCQDFWPPGRGREWRHGDCDARDGGVGMRREDRCGCPDYWPNGGDLHRLNGGQSSGNDGFAWRGGGRRPDPCAHRWRALP